MSWSVLFSWVLYSSAVTGVLIVLLLGIKLAFQNVARSSWHHALWILVIIKLLVPFGPESRFSLFNLIPISRRAIAGESVRPAIVSRDRGIEAMAVPFVESIGSGGGPIGQASAGESGVSAATPAKPAGIAHVLFLVWVVGMAVFALATLFAQATFRRRLYGKSEEIPAEDEFFLIRADCMKRVGVSRRIGLFFSSAVSVPALYGFFKPRILLPISLRTDLSDGDISLIFLHELAHFKRKDNAWNLTTSLLQIVH
jgi:bla regulator protein BlaR1